MFPRPKSIAITLRHPQLDKSGPPDMFVQEAIFPAFMGEVVSPPGRDIVEQFARRAVSQAKVISRRRDGMKSTKQTARIGGGLYLVNAVTGLFSIIYICRSV